jgi:hypothetical protein
MGRDGRKENGDGETVIGHRIQESGPHNVRQKWKGKKMKGARKANDSRTRSCRDVG